MSSFVGVKRPLLSAASSRPSRPPSATAASRSQKQVLPPSTRQPASVPAKTMPAPNLKSVLPPTLLPTDMKQRIKETSLRTNKLLEKVLHGRKSQKNSKAASKNKAAPLSSSPAKKLAKSMPAPKRNAAPATPASKIEEHVSQPPELQPNGPMQQQRLQPPPHPAQQSNWSPAPPTTADPTPLTSLQASPSSQTAIDIFTQERNRSTLRGEPLAGETELGKGEAPVTMDESWKVFQAQERIIYDALAKSSANVSDERGNAGEGKENQAQPLTKMAEDPLRLSQLDLGKPPVMPDSLHRERAFEDAMKKQLHALETVQDRMYNLNRQFWEKHRLLMAEQTENVQLQALQQMKHLQQLQTQQTQWQNMQIVRLRETLHSQNGSPVKVRVPSVLSMQTQSETKKSKAVQDLHERLEKLQSDFRRFLDNVEEIKWTMDRVEAKQMKQKDTDPVVHQAVLRDIPLKDRLNYSPLDSILEDIQKSRKATEPATHSVHQDSRASSMLGGRFDYTAAAQMMDDLKAIRKQISAGIRPTSPTRALDNTFVLEGVDLHGEKTHLSEESTLADLREMFPTTRLEHLVQKRIEQTEIEPVIQVPQEPVVKTVNASKKTVTMEERVTRVDTDHMPAKSVIRGRRTMTAPRQEETTEPPKKGPPVRKQVVKKPIPKHQRPVSPIKERAESPTRMARSATPSPTKTSLPRFYTVRLSEKPVFLRRTTIRPPSMEFQSTPLDPEPLPKSPIRKEVKAIVPSPKKKAVPKPPTLSPKKEMTSTMMNTDPTVEPVIERLQTPEQLFIQRTYSTCALVCIAFDGDADIGHVYDEAIQTSPPPVVERKPTTPVRKPLTFDMSIETDREEVTENTPGPVMVVARTQTDFKETVQPKMVTAPSQTDDVKPAESSVPPAPQVVFVQAPQQPTPDADWEDRMKEWMQAQLLARLPSKLPSRDQSSSVSDLLAAVRSTNVIAEDIRDKIIADVLNREIRLVLINLLERLRWDDEEARRAQKTIVDEVVKEECEETARSGLAEAIRKQKEIVAIELQAAILKEGVDGECHDAADWALRNQTPEPIPSEPSSELRLPPVLPELDDIPPPTTPTPPPMPLPLPVREDIAVQTEAPAVVEVMKEPSIVSEKSVPVSSNTGTSSTTLTTLSTNISEGELFTDLFSDGEVVEPMDRNKIVECIQKNAPVFNTNSKGKLELVKPPFHPSTSSSHSSTTSQEFLESEESLASSREEPTLSKGEVRNAVAGEPQPSHSSMDFSAGENSLSSGRSLGQQTMEVGPETPTRAKANEIAVQPPSFLQSSTLSPISHSQLDALPSPITSPIQQQPGTEGDNFDTTVHVEQQQQHQQQQQQPLQEAREILQYLGEMSREEINAKRSTSQASYVSGVTSIPDVVSDGEVEHLDDATLRAMDF